MWELDECSDFLRRFIPSYLKMGGTKACYLFFILGIDSGTNQHIQLFAPCC